MRAALLFSVLLGIVTGVSPAAEQQPTEHFERAVRPVLAQYCGECHSDAESDVPFLTAQTAADLNSARSLWSSVAAQLQNRTMPPADEPQPSETQRLEIAQWITHTLRATACRDGEYAGPVTVRRLNRLEYNNTVRALFGIDLEFEKTFPVDSGGGEGFDNNGETLFLPPLLMERYLTAAQQIVDTAIISPPVLRIHGPLDFLPVDPSRVVGEDPQTGKPLHGERYREVPAGDRVSVLQPIPVDGMFRIVAAVSPLESGELTVPVLIDGITAAKLTFRPYAREFRSTEEETQVRLTRGTHLIALGAPKSTAIEVTRIKIEQIPREPSPTQRVVHRRLLGKRIGDVPSEPRSAARRLLKKFLPQAFRRPVTTAEINRFLTLYDRAAERGDPYEERIKLAIKGMLVAPDFLFRIERPAASSEPEPLSEHELATRLSYFLWSTMPDRELTLLANNGELHLPDVLTAQVDRMLDDGRADLLFERFVGQWLGTQDVGGRIAPTENAIQDFYTPDIARDMRTEAVLLFEHIVREDRTVLDLLNADYTFVTGRLAKFYGMPGVEGLARSEFQRVPLTDGRRGGVLGLGAVLAATSHTSERETSPVLRGAWVLETLFGTPVPSPPPDVPALDKEARKKQNLTLRETLQKHREHASCAACHDLIDPIGFGLENFDFLGRWRDEQEGQPIDATGTMPSGETFNGPAELRYLLLQRKREFCRQLVRKLLGYALGRSLVDADQCAIERLIDHLQQHEYRGRELIRSIVLSKPFRFKQVVLTE